MATRVVVTFECQRCGAGHELNLGNRRITLRSAGEAGAATDASPPEATAADAAEAPAHPLRRQTDAQLQEAIKAAIAAHGPLSRTAMATHIGVSKGSHTYATHIPKAISTLLQAGEIAQAGTSRGHPLYGLTSPATAVLGDTSSLATDDTSPRALDDTSPDAAAPDDGSASSSDTSPAPGSDTSPGSRRRQAREAALQARTNTARTQAEQRKAKLRDQLLEALDQHGELTIQDIAEKLGVRVVNINALRAELERARIISWRRAKPGTEQPLYYRVPHGNDAEGVEVTNGGTDHATLRALVATTLGEQARTVPELAALLEQHVAVVAQAVSVLQREGVVTKQPGGRYLRATR